MQVSSAEPVSLPVRGSRVQQAPFVRPAQMSLFARVSCYPPLAQVSCPQRIQKTLELEKDDTVSCQSPVNEQTSNDGVATLHCCD